MKKRNSISIVSYDGTNFYTFINTFNVKNTLGKRGKNKQGRSNLRQVSYALFCTKEGIQLYYMENIKAFFVDKSVYEKEYRLVVMHNKKLSKVLDDTCKIPSRSTNRNG